MTINFRKPPSGADSALSQGLDRIAKSEMVSSVRPRTFGIRAAQQTLPPPYQVFSLGLDDLIEDKPLSAATADGWRYFVQAEGSEISSAEVRTLNEAQHKFSQLDLGPYVNNTLSTLLSLESDPRVQGASYEPQLLRVPALYFVSLWLKEASQRNILVPIAPTPPGIQANKFYSEPELRPILVHLAQEKLQKQRELGSGYTSTS